MQHSFEIEIKSLLGSKDLADNLIEQMKLKDKNLKILGSHKQRNHYFTPTPSKTGQTESTLKSLYNNIENLLDDASKVKLKDLVEKAKDFSVRTREADGKVILVIKAAVDDTTSSNGTARLEWEHLINLGLSELDSLVLSASFTYQAKWSRERQDLVYTPTKRPINVSIDKNAGYGYLAEFEVVTEDQSKAEEVKAFIREIMKDLEVLELPQDRLQRMFDFYNKNWREYYGTDRVFNIE